MLEERPSFWRRGLWWKLPLLAFVVFLGLYGYLHLSVASKFRRIRAAGQPVTLAELNAWYALPEGPNAADVYVRAFDAMVQDVAIEDLDFPGWDDTIDAATIQIIGNYLARNQEAIRLLHEAATIESCRYDIDMTQDRFQPGSFFMDHYGLTRRAAMLLRWHAILQSHLEQPDEAVTSLHAILRLARSLRDEPILIAHQVQNVIEVNACRALQTVLGSADLTDEHLARLGSAMADHAGDASMVRALVGERCYGLHTMIEQFPLPLRFVERRAYLEMMERLIAFAADPTATMDDQHAVVDAVPSRARVTGIAASGIAAALLSEQVRQAILNRTITAIAVRRYQLANGEPPATLNDLVPRFLPAVPRDPSQGLPMSLTVTPTELIVFSAKPNTTDNTQGVTDRERERDGVHATFTIRR